MSSRSQIGAAKPTFPPFRAMKEAHALGGNALAFIIVSARQMTDSRMRTIRARPLLLCAGMIGLAAMSASALVGYFLGQSQVSGAHVGAGAAVLDFRQAVTVIPLVQGDVGVALVEFLALVLVDVPRNTVPFAVVLVAVRAVEEELIHLKDVLPDRKVLFSMAANAEQYK